MVWIGYRQFDQENSIRPVAIARYDEGYVETVKGTWADSERGNGPLGTAIRTGRPCWTKDIRRDANFAIWKGEALRSPFKDLMASRLAPSLFMRRNQTPSTRARSSSPRNWLTIGRRSDGALPSSSK